MRLLAPLLLVAACRDERLLPQPTSLVAELPDAGPVATVAGHGGRIDQLAVVETGDAALTADHFRDIRLWPALDGSREPVIVHLGDPVQLVLGKTPDGFLAAARDRAGGIELALLGRDGRELEHVQLPAEPATSQLVIANGMLLARRADHTIARFDAHGRPRGVVMPEPGERVLYLAARNGRAFAGIGGDGITALRALDLGGTLRLGPRIELAESWSQLALSPSGKRLLAMRVSATERVVQGFELAGTAVKTEPISTLGGFGFEVELGFADETTLVVSERQVMHGQGAARTTLTMPTDGTLAIGDRVVVGTMGTGLSIMRDGIVKYLGYRFVRVDSLHGAGDSVIATYSSRTREKPVVWLDRTLRIVRRAWVPWDREPIAADDRYLVTTRYDKRENAVDVYDTAATPMTSHEAARVTYPSFYAPTAHVFVAEGKRLAIDLVTGTSKELRPLEMVKGAFAMPLDPELADGAVAVATSRDVVEYFVDAPGTGPLTPAKTIPTSGSFMGLDRRGRFYTYAGEELTIFDRTHEPRKLSIGFARLPPELDGDSVPTLTRDAVAVYELDGKLRWRYPIRDPQHISFIDGGQVAIVWATSGLVALDGKTGARLASGCAWGFTLSGEPLDQSIYASAPVCGAN